jgi:hypothetical protein
VKPRSGDILWQVREKSRPPHGYNRQVGIILDVRDERLHPGISGKVFQVWEVLYRPLHSIEQRLLRTTWIVRISNRWFIFTEVVTDAKNDQMGH